MSRLPTRVILTDTIHQGFAADIPATVQGYVLSGNPYFDISFALGTMMGLGALALRQTPAFPTYPRVSWKPIYFLVAF